MGENAVCLTSPVIIPVLAEGQSPRDKILSASALKCLSLNEIRRGDPNDVVAKHGYVTLRVCTSVFRIASFGKELAKLSCQCHLRTPPPPP